MAFRLLKKTRRENICLSSDNVLEEAVFDDLSANKFEVSHNAVTSLFNLVGATTKSERVECSSRFSGTKVIKARHCKSNGGPWQKESILRIAVNGWLSELEASSSPSFFD